MKYAEEKQKKNIQSLILRDLHLVVETRQNSTWGSED